MGELAPACAYDVHRGSDWLRRDVGLVSCGVCHPPVGLPAEAIATRTDPDFGELVTGSAGGGLRQPQRTCADCARVQPDAEREHCWYCGKPLDSAEAA